MNKMAESANHENLLSVINAGNKSRMDELTSLAEKNGWNAAINACREALPSTAADPNESSYERGRFDGVMDYARAIRRLYRA